MDERTKAIDSAVRNFASPWQVATAAYDEGVAAEREHANKRVAAIAADRESWREQALGLRPNQQLTRAHGIGASADQTHATDGPVLPFMFIAMDDDKRVQLTWCADEAEVRAAVQVSMFWSHDGKPLDEDHSRQLDGVVEELLDSGCMTFEGDPPLYLFRMGRACK